MRNSVGFFFCVAMQYTKPPLTFEQQAELLLNRGLVADRDVLISRLETVNYYRFSGYLYPYRLPDDSFKLGTTLATVWRQYTFDRKLRLLVLDAVERVEVALRTRLAYDHAHAHGPFAYRDRRSLPGLSRDAHDAWIAELSKEVSASRERFVEHFRNKYGNAHTLPPIWIAIELMSFGKTFTFFRGCDPSIQKDISAWIGAPDRVFFSWLRTINEVRNVCAHHGRLWNRDLGNNPLLPNERKYPDWYHPCRVTQSKMFGVLTILKFMLKKAAPTSKWYERFASLLAEYPDLPLLWMGFPSNWMESPLWSGVTDA